MPNAAGGRRRGRWAEGLRNDDAVIEAARDVLRIDMGTSMAQIAAQAHVGVGSLYRRYPTRQALVVQVCFDGMRRVEIAAHRAAGRLSTDPWMAFADFMVDALACGAGSFVQLAGTFPVPPDLVGASERLHAAMDALLAGAQSVGAVRDDISTADIELVLEQLQSIKLPDPERVDELRQRHLALVLPSLRPPRTLRSQAALPGPPPQWAEIRRRWTPDV